MEEENQEFDMLSIIQEVYDITSNNGELESYYSAFLLLGSLSEGQVCRLDSDDELCILLQDNFGDDHDLWNFVTVEE